MTILEKDLEAKLVKAIKDRGGYAIKWISPGTTGLPDRIVILPGERIAFVEMKRPKGSRVGKLQDYWCRELASRGFMYRRVFTEGQLQGLLVELDYMEVRT